MQHLSPSTRLAYLTCFPRCFGCRYASENGTDGAADMDMSTGAKHSRVELWAPVARSMAIGRFSSAYCWSQSVLFVQKQRFENGHFVQKRHFKNGNFVHQML